MGKLTKAGWLDQVDPEGWSNREGIAVLLMVAMIFAVIAWFVLAFAPVASAQQPQSPPPSNEELLQGQVNVLQQQNDWLNKIIARLKSDEEARESTLIEWLKAAQAQPPPQK